MSLDRSEFQALLSRARNGDEQAAAQLVERYGLYLRTIIRHELSQRVRCRVGDSDIAQQVFQVLFTRALNEEDFPDAAALMAYLRAVARSQVHDAHREHLDRDKRSLDRTVALVVDPADPHPSAERIAAAKDQVEALLHSLTLVEQRVIMLLGEGYSQREAAEREGICERTVARILLRVRAHCPGRLE